jgi:nickel transport protein
MKIEKILFICLVLVLIPLNIAFAHKVIIFAWVEDGMIYSQSSFGSKRKAKDCAIKVENGKGIIIHKGQTDQEGNHSFKIPKNIDSDLVLTLVAGTGHQAQWKILIDELVAKPSDKDIPTIMEEKENLEKDPSILKILTGIAIIFILAMAAKFFKKEKS